MVSAGPTGNVTTESTTTVDVPEAASRSRPFGGWVRLARWPGLALFFAAATVVQTWPLAKHANDSITTWSWFPFDAWVSLWSLWWVKEAVLTGQNPYHTDLLFSPQGTDLYLGGLMLVTGTMSIPFQVLTGNLILSWNLVALLSVVLTGIGTYALAYRVTGNHLAAVVAGFIFAFAPYFMMRLGGHWIIFVTWPIPFLLLFLLRFQDSGRMLDAALASLFWVFLTINWIEFAVDASIFIGIFFLYWTIVYLWRGDRARLVRFWSGGVVIGLVWLILSGPVLLGTMQDVRNDHFFLPSGDEQFSADVLTFVTPSILWGPGTTPLVGGPNPYHLPVGSVENTAYLGGMPLLLATVALFTVRKNPHRLLIWVITFAAFLVLSLGPYLYIDDSRHHSLFGWSFSIPLPYQIFDEIPLVGNRRAPVRMVVFAILALSILAAIGLDFIMGWLKQRWRLLAPAAALLVLGVVWLEYWNPPVDVIEHRSPAVFSDIGKEDGDFTVVHAPMGRRTGWTITGHPSGGAIDNYYQPLYGKRSMGGYISRVSDEEFSWFLEQPGLRFLACTLNCGVEPPQGDDANAELVRSVLTENRIRYVVVHKLGPDGNPLFYFGVPEVQGMERYLSEVVGLEQVYVDPTVAVYRNDDTG